MHTVALREIPTRFYEQNFIIKSPCTNLRRTPWLESWRHFENTGSRNPGEEIPERDFKEIPGQFLEESWKEFLEKFLDETSWEIMLELQASSLRNFRRVPGKIFQYMLKTILEVFNKSFEKYPLGLQLKFIGIISGWIFESVVKALLVSFKEMQEEKYTKEYYWNFWNKLCMIFSGNPGSFPARITGSNNTRILGENIAEFYRWISEDVPADTSGKISEEIYGGVCEKNTCTKS